MDARRFDRLSRALSTRPSRRRLLRSLASGVLAALGGRVAAEDAAARDRCRNKPDLCKSMSERSRCAGATCFCLTTVGGKKECVNLANVDCPRRDECDDDEDCRGEDNLCMVVQRCCRSPRNVCARRCGAGANATAASSGDLPLLRRP